MLHFEGDRDFARPPAELWAKLSDASFLVSCIPDAEAVTVSEPKRAVCQVRPGLSFVRGNLEVTIDVSEAVEGKSARYRVDTKGVGSNAVVEANLTFLPQDAGTRVHWAAEIQQLGGLLKMVPQGLIKASAQKVIGDVWQSIESKLSESS